MPRSYVCSCGRVSGAPRCPAHAKRQYAPKTGFYQSAQWNSLAKQAKARDGGCRMKNEMCKGRLTAHHIIPREEGGPDLVSNLITLCSRHHAWTESQLRHGHNPLTES